MWSEDEFIEFRQRIIESFDVYDLVEFLNLTVEDWLDNTSEWEDNKELQLKVGMLPEDESDD